MSQYSTGTATVTNGSATVTGTNTLWLANVTAGDSFTVAGDGVMYDVASVDSDTQVTLSVAYSGVTASGVVYTIARDFTSPDNFPELTTGDIETPTIITRALRKIQSKFNTSVDQGALSNAEIFLSVAAGLSGTSSGDLFFAVDGSEYVLYSNDAGSAVEEARFANFVSVKALSDAAAVSASNASTSEGNAATSETNAGNSATASQSSADDAQSSEDDAEASALAASNSETNAGDSETAAAVSESNAGTSETNAATSEGNASTSETNAGNSASTATAQAVISTAQAELSEEWADAALGVEIEPGKYSARHWAEQLGAIPNTAYNWQGDWSAGTYNAGDALFHTPSKSSYITLVTTTDEPDITGSSDWDLLAQAAEVLGEITVTKTAISKTLATNEYCFVTASTKTITLPASPSPGDVVAVGVQAFEDTVIARNGENIMSLAQDMTIDKENALPALIYVDASEGWRIL
jgi:hypothetical protein